MSPGRLTPRRTVLLLAALAAAVYGRTFGHEFLFFDDFEYVTHNPHVLAGITRDGVAWAFSAFHAANWHPLAWLSHMADAELFGADPGWHHLSSAVLHGANAILLFLLLRRATGALRRSALAAALFAVHPQHVESVAWIAERKDVLCAFFSLLTLHAWVRYAERPGVWSYLAAAGFLSFALLSKPMAVTLPFALLLLDVWPLGRTPVVPPADGSLRRPVPYGRLLLEKAPLLLLSAAASAATLAAQGRAGTVIGWDVLPLGVRLANGAVSYASYLGAALWPSSLAVFYPHPGASLPAWKGVVAAALLGAVTAAAWRERRRRPWLLFGWLWFLGTLVPVIGLVQVSGQARADRFAYLPSVGLYVAASFGAAELCRASRVREGAAAAGAAVVVGSLAAAAFAQAGHWRNQETLVDRALATTRGNWLAENSKGVLLLERGDAAGAARHFRNALSANPFFPPARENLNEALEALEASGATSPRPPPSGPSP